MRFVRFPIQAVLFIMEWISSLQEMFVFKLMGFNKRTEYQREGSCQKTGQCCRTVGVRLPARALTNDKFLRFYKKWYAFRFNFNLVDHQKDLLIYSCNYLTPDNRCSIYHFRPKVCRDFPKPQLHGHVQLFKTCGYQFKRRSSKSFGV